MECHFAVSMRFGKTCCDCLLSLQIISSCRQMFAFEKQVFETNTTFCATTQTFFEHCLCGEMTLFLKTCEKTCFLTASFCESCFWSSNDWVEKASF